MPIPLRIPTTTAKQSLIKSTTEDGNTGFITYGTTTNTDDETVVTYPYVLGKYTGNLPKVGTFFTFFENHTGLYTLHPRAVPFADRLQRTELHYALSPLQA